MSTVPLHQDHRPPDHNHGAKPSTIVLTVFAPIEPRPKRIPFDVHLTIGAAARIAADRFGYSADTTPSFRLADGTVLDRSIALDVAGLKNKDEVELVDTGGGV